MGEWTRLLEEEDRLEKAKAKASAEAKARAEAAEQERKERKEWCAKIRAKMAERNMDSLLRRAERNMVREMTDKERLLRRVIGESTSWADLLQNFLPPRQSYILREPHLCAQCRRNRSEHITLHVRYNNDPKQTTMFKIKPGTPLRKMREAYCMRWHSEVAKLRFMVVGFHREIQQHDTAEKLGLTDGDIIAAFDDP